MTMIKIATSETAQVWSSEPDHGIVKLSVRGQSDFDANVVSVDELRSMLPLHGFTLTPEGRKLLAGDERD